MSNKNRSLMEIDELLVTEFNSIGHVQNKRKGLLYALLPGQYIHDPETELKAEMLSE